MRNHKFVDLITGSAEKHPYQPSYRYGLVIFTVLFIALITACSTTNKVPTFNKGDFHSSQTGAGKITAKIPDYSSRLTAIKGKAKAVVSGPKKTHRVTLYFSGNRQRSLIDVKNTVGIEGAKILAHGDSLLIYNKVKKYARKISVTNSDLHGIDHLATVNLLKLVNPVVKQGTVKQVRENEDTYLLALQSGGNVYVKKKAHVVRQITQPKSADMPYSKIIYSGYSQIEGLTLPRRITIFSADRSTRIDLLVKSLQVNPSLQNLTIHLPNGTKIYHQ
jgi:hypothetical protein